MVAIAEGKGGRSNNEQARIRVDDLFVIIIGFSLLVT